MNPLKQLAGQTAIYGLSSVLARILNFLLVPFYTRIFVDTAEYGIINELYAYVAFLIIVLTYGMETAFFRFTSKHNNSQLVFSTSVISLIITSILFAIIIIFFFPTIAQLIGYGEKANFVLILGIVLSFDAMAAIPFARLRYMNKALKFALIKLFNICTNIFFNIFFLIIIPFLIDRGYSFFIFDIIYDPDFKVGYVFVSNFLASFFTLLFFLKDIIRTRFIFSWGLLKSMLFYSFPLLIAGLAGTVNEVIDRIMLRYRLPSEINALEQIGIYGANIKIAVLMTLFIQMFRYAFEPFFFSQEKNIYNRKLYADVLHYFVIFGIFGFLFITLYIDIFKYIIGPQYREGLDIVPVVLLGNLMLGIYFNLSVWYKLKEMTIYGAVFATTGAIVTLSVNYWFIPLFGYLASAWAHFFSYFVMVILAYFSGRFYYPVPYKISWLLFYFTVGFLLYILSVLVYVEGMFLRMSINTLFILIFVVLAYFIEKKNIIEIVKK
ncbi:MAG: oligosaccharide flippase family protein [Cyclobacteriaceae bacterium]